MCNKAREGEKLVRGYCLLTGKFRGLVRDTYRLNTRESLFDLCL